jgi:calcineurin-like phosphoesterase family protein
VPSPLRLVHLSDIHFNQRSDGIGFDPDEDLRSELRRDLEMQVATLGKLDAVLVSGDIAYAGKKEEYRSATVWLDELSLSAGCPGEVYVVPGNHDVDRDIIRANSLLQDAHDAIRGKLTAYDRDTALKRRLEETEARMLFYAPLSEFNEFAAVYECTFFADADSYAWDRPLPLSDGSTLLVRGLNSALLSGLSDAEGTLFLGSRAFTMPRRTGVEYLTLCHHPPNWLQDGKDMAAALDDRAKIQLFGHEHDQRVVPYRDQMKLFAGAVNPHRAEPNWRPGYNIIEVSILCHGTSRAMNINVHAREWQQTVPRQFRAIMDRRSNPVHHLEIELEPWQPPVMEDPLTPETTPPPTSSEPTETAGPERLPLSPRELVNRFFRLSISKKSEILGQLDLLVDADRSLPDVERNKRAILRAKERNQLLQLAKLIIHANS